MRERWRRGSAEIALKPAQIADLLAPIFPRAVVRRFERVRGGLVNTNLRVVLQNRSDAVLLRIYQRNVEQGLKEAALIRRMVGRVPVPRLLYAAERNSVTGHPYAVMHWVDGRRLDKLPLDDADLDSAARAIGKALARVHAVKFERFGFLGTDLKIARPIDFDRRGLLAYLEHSFAAGPGPARLGKDLVAELAAFVEREGDRIASWPGSPCLAHGDCNGSNFLLRRGPEGWELAALLDWEFALSATPGFDLAHFLRPPIARHVRFVEAVAASYRDAGEKLPQDWRRAAQVTDLFAWIDILSRPDADPGVIDDARACVRTIIAA
jgi:aminoglycoside phosphotransferase (APT) family kinase protein